MDARGMTFAWNRGLVWVLAAGLTLVSARAQNLLEGAQVLVTTNLTAATTNWAPEIVFNQAKRHDLRLRVVFNVASSPSVPVLSLKKPAHIVEWTLNGQALLGPPKDMFCPVLEGIPTSALKSGTNVLEAVFRVSVFLRDGKLSPRNTGDLGLDLQPADLKRFEIRTGPVLGAAGSDYFTVSCRTRMPATVTLHCDGRTWTGKPGVIHRLRADGLKEGQQYEYKLVADLVGGGATASSKTWKVRTLSGKAPLTFVALGDARNNPKIWGRITAKVLDFKPAFALHTGDIVGNGNDYEAWDTEFSKPAEAFLATIPCFYTFGNHENNVAMLYDFFGFPGGDRGNYTQVVGPVQVLAMNRFENWGKGSKNMVWMEKELAASTAPFVFTFTHPPAWSSGSHGNDKLGIEVHYPLFDKYGVTAVMAGHDHCYERSEPGGATMLITGGGGAHLYKPEHAKGNPHSKIYRSEYNFLVFQVGEKTCEMKAWVFGGLNTPDNERKLEEVDHRVWEPRKAGATP